MTRLVLAVDLDGTVYCGDAPVRYYAGLIACTLAPALAPAAATAATAEDLLPALRAWAADPGTTATATGGR